MKKLHILSTLALVCWTATVSLAQRPAPVERHFGLDDPIVLSGSSLLVRPSATGVESTSPAPAPSVTSPAATPPAVTSRIGVPTDAEARRILNDVDDSTSRQLPVAGQAERVTQRFSNGKPQIERWVVLAENGNYVNHGSFKQFDAKGTPVVNGEFVMGQRQGEWFQSLDARTAQGLASNIDRGFTPPFMSEVTFQGGTLSGDWTLIDSKGKTVFIWNFENGMRSGQSSWYNSKGEIIQSIPYENNIAHGMALITSRSEGTTREIEYRHGFVLDVVEKFHTTGKKRIVKSREEFLIPMATQIRDHDWANSSVAIERRTDVEPVKHGKSVYYHTNGQRISEGEYRQGLETGTFVWWYANGQRQAIGQFENGQEVGPWHFWHSNGMKKTVGQFDAGAPTGQWLTWNEQGQLIKRQNGAEVQLSSPARVAELALNSHR